MPSLEHEEIVELFVRDLPLAIKLARATGKVQVPDHDSLEAGPTEVHEQVPASLRVDAVLRSFSWPFYVAGARLRYRLASGGGLRSPTLRTGRKPYPHRSRKRQASKQPPPDRSPQ